MYRLYNSTCNVAPICAKKMCITERGHHNFVRYLEVPNYIVQRKNKFLEFWGIIENLVKVYQHTWNIRSSILNFIYKLGIKLTQFLERNFSVIRGWSLWSLTEVIKNCWEKSTDWSQLFVEIMQDESTREIKVKLTFQQAQLYSQLGTGSHKTPKLQRWWTEHI